MTDTDTKVVITMTDADAIANLENALGVVEEHLGAPISRGAGRPARDEITLEDAVEEMAVAYAGVDVTEVSNPSHDR